MGGRNARQPYQPRDHMTLERELAFLHVGKVSLFTGKGTGKTALVCEMLFLGASSYRFEFQGLTDIIPLSFPFGT
jgi:hypothetical protein